MSPKAPWTEPAWRERAEERFRAGLEGIDRAPTGPFELIRAWGRACLWSVPTASGRVWIKQAYRLPPGEEHVLPRLAERWAGSVPAVVATFGEAVAMDELPGRELAENDPLADWLDTARLLGRIAAGESEHAEDWLALGLRDRRAAAWRPAVEALVESPVVRALEPELSRDLEAMLPDFIARYETAFCAAPTLVHQDSGCCNVHVGKAGPVLFDWTDVVVGHGAFSCDRLLDQVPPERKEAVIAAFLECAGFERAEFDAMRRSNVLHEVLRYHDELEWLSPDDEVHGNLSRSVRSQLRVLIEHERRRR